MSSDRPEWICCIRANPNKPFTSWCRAPVKQTLLFSLETGLALLVKPERLQPCPDCIQAGLKAFYKGDYKMDRPVFHPTLLAPWLEAWWNSNASDPASRFLAAHMSGIPALEQTTPNKAPEGLRSMAFCVQLLDRAAEEDGGLWRAALLDQDTPCPLTGYPNWKKVLDHWSTLETLCREDLSHPNPENTLSRVGKYLAEL